MTWTAEQACAAAATVEGRTIDAGGVEGPTITGAGIEGPPWPATAGGAVPTNPASEIMAKASTEVIEILRRRRPAATGIPPATFDMQTSRNSTPCLRGDTTAPLSSVSQIPTVNIDLTGGPVQPFG